MIVEDDPALQKQMRWAFDQYETVVASNREEAIAQRICFCSAGSSSTISKVLRFSLI